MIYTNEILKKKLHKKEKIKKIFKIISVPFIAILVVIIVYIGYLKFIKNENDINILGFRQYIVMTGSMEPNYNIGDLIIIKEEKKENIKENDVITYALEREKDTITHRIIEIVEKNGKTMYKTKGDNNNSEDSTLVEYEQIQGVVLFKIDKLGTIITKILSLTGITIIVTLIIISFIHSTRKEERRIAREDARKLYNIPKYKREKKKYEFLR